MNIATTTQATDESISSLDQCEGACKEIKCICPLLRNTEHDTEVHPVLQSRSITYSNSAKKKKKHMREETERRISVCMCVCVCMLPPSCDRGYHCHSTFFVSEAQKKKKNCETTRLQLLFFFFSSTVFFSRVKVCFSIPRFDSVGFPAVKENVCFFFYPLLKCEAGKKENKNKQKARWGGKRKKKEKHEKRRGLRRGNSCNVQVCKRACSKEGCHAHQPPTHAAGQEK